MSKMITGKQLLKMLIENKLKLDDGVNVLQKVTWAIERKASIGELQIANIFKHNYELLDDDIDIQSIGELTDNYPTTDEIGNKINKLIKAVKQLDRKMEER